MDKLRTYYDNLKVTRNAPSEVIRATYKTPSQKCHPDKHPGNADAERVMALINGSYEVPSEPVILGSVRIQSNYPGPRVEAAWSGIVGGQARKTRFELTNHTGEVGKHHPLLAFVVAFVADWPLGAIFWLRPGNTHSLN